MAKRKRKGRETLQDHETAAYKQKYSKFMYEDGRPVPWADFPVINSSATWAQKLFEPMNKQCHALDPITGKFVLTKEPSVERALIPYLVVFGVENSAASTIAQKQYAITYSPNGDAALALTSVVKRWRAWVKNPLLLERGISLESTITTYPMISKLGTAEVISDKEYNEIWQSVKKSGKYRAAGHPQDPNTVLIQDITFDPYRGGDSFSGMQGLTEYG